MDAYKTNVFIWGLFLTSSMIAAIHLWPNYVSNSEIYKNTKFENIENVFNITQNLIQEHSEEILNAKCLEYSPLSWAKSVLANDQALKRAKAKALCPRRFFSMYWSDGTSTGSHSTKMERTN